MNIPFNPATIELVAALETKAAAAQPMPRDSVSLGWPFTFGAGVLAGVLDCRRGAEGVVSPGGQTCPLNGIAPSAAQPRGYSQLQNVWPESPTLPGAQMPGGPVVRLGLERC